MSVIHLCYFHLYCTPYTLFQALDAEHNKKISIKLINYIFIL